MSNLKTKLKQIKQDISKMELLENNEDFATLFSIVLTIFLARIISTFTLAFSFSRKWSLAKMWGWFPVIAFHTDNATFTRLNSYSILITTIIAATILIYQISKNNQNRSFLWLLGLWMTGLQFLIALYLNKYFNFSTTPTIGLPVFIVIFMSSGVYFKNYLKSKQ